ncbi:MAG: PTS sugar transporter subunit IIA [Syntrophorhabdaceae bacterium]
MRLGDILKESTVICDIKGTTKKDILTELVTPLKDAGLIHDIEPVVRVVLERESLGSTGIGDGVAIPHGKLNNANEVMCVFARSQRGVDFDAIDGEPVHIFFLVLAPRDAASVHLMVLSRISRILRDPSFRKKLLNLSDAHSLYESIREEDEKL